jgi:hypothetical protein
LRLFIIRDRKRIHGPKLITAGFRGNDLHLANLCISLRISAPSALKISFFMTRILATAHGRPVAQRRFGFWFTCVRVVPNPVPGE